MNLASGGQRSVAALTGREWALTKQCPPPGSWEAWTPELARIVPLNRRAASLAALAARRPFGVPS